MCLLSDYSKECMSTDNSSLVFTFVHQNRERITLNVRAPWHKDQEWDVGINWSAIGSTDIEATRSFARLLNKASELGEFIQKIINQNPEY